VHPQKVGYVARLITLQVYIEKRLLKKGITRDVPTSQMQLFVIISRKMQGGAL
jgi:hypothetical protein